MVNKTEIKTENKTEASITTRITQKGNVLYIQIVGEIDHHSAAGLREKVDKAFERLGCKHMIFDFSQVTFMDSSGIGMIIGRYKNAEQKGGTVSIAGMNAELSRIYNISGLAKIVGSYATVPETEQRTASAKTTGDML